MIRLSLFKIGFILSIIGIIGVGFIFSESEKISQSFHLDREQVTSFDLKLQNQGIGFYKISIPDLGDAVFIQVLDSEGNILADKKIETKMAVNFFDFEYSGVYTIKVTNLSNHILPIDVEFGDTGVSQIKNPGIILFCGIMLMIISGYIKLKNYKIAQPDENISQNGKHMIVLPTSKDRLNPSQLIEKMSEIIEMGMSFFYFSIFY